ncbi:4'-phosphopantetheinyl transferase family protein [Microbispora triticiradicis]|uniref:4'-phosphopantetheinyl transferase family protein n=1 Tax=Microbispora triticiradicis TaxID=2200763 RepID=UPI001AD6BB19|nr:4'-phosphopantetheinyl transferase superfamily protein [Microbispora triticiradicis]MBO4270663.1 4'-phosphopantetheinyl transferase superfamily protein [Microbispora triticiradicis]
MNEPAAIRSILPPGVVAVDTFHDAHDGMLFAAEEKAVSRSVDKRRNEFTTARICARRAMKLLGVPEQPILRGDQGEPKWPAGLVGSITHCAGYRGAVLAPRGEVVTLGIDAEPDDALTNGVLEAISLPEERLALQKLARKHPGVAWDRLLFSAKEAVYKAWFPLTKRWLDFEDAMVTIDPDNGRFTAALKVKGPYVSGAQLTGFSGRWIATNGLLLAAIVVPAQSR